MKVLLFQVNESTSMIEKWMRTLITKYDVEMLLFYGITFIIKKDKNGCSIPIKVAEGTERLCAIVTLVRSVRNDNHDEQRNKVCACRTLARPSGMRSINFFSARCASCPVGLFDFIGRIFLWNQKGSGPNRPDPFSWVLRIILTRWST